MTSRSTLHVFDVYQKARLAFVQSIADLALRSQNVDILTKAGVIDLIRPLLNDPCPQIRECSAIALGRLVHHDACLAEKILNDNFMPILLNCIYTGGKHQKKAILFVIRSICKHNANCANFVVSAGGLQSITACLEDFESCVKESAAWGIGYIARHNAELAQACVAAGAVPLLMLCVQEPELTLKQIATSAISDVATHTVELAQNVVDAGVVPYLVKNLSNTDERLKRQILCALSSCAKHTTELAEVVVEAEIFPSVLLHLGHKCPIVRRNAACLVRDIVRHSLELTQLVVNTGGIGALIEVLNQSTGTGAGVAEGPALPTITALGFIAGHSEQLALSVLGCKAIITLREILQTRNEDAILAVTAWTIGQIGKHSPEHTQAVAAADILPRLLELYLSPTSSEDLRFKCKNALKQCLQKCLLVSALEPLLYDAPAEILKYVLGQYSKVLPQDPQARRVFVTSGGLRKIQELDAKPGSTLYEYVTVVNSCFPEEIVRYYSPGYPETLLDKIEQYSPQMMTVLRESNMHDSENQTMMGNILEDAQSTDDDEKNAVI